MCRKQVKAFLSAKSQLKPDLEVLKGLLASEAENLLRQPREDRQHQAQRNGLPERFPHLAVAMSSEAQDLKHRRKIERVERGVLA
jgi:hypothetical protein